MKKKVTKRIAVWMDHSKAQFIDPAAEPLVIEIVPSGVSTRKKIHTGNFSGNAGNNEFSTNQRYNNEIRSYYNLLAKKLLFYDEILIFGPTTAQEELHNFLLNNKHFIEKKIIVDKENYFSDKQLLAYVKQKFMSGLHSKIF